MKSELFYNYYMLETISLASEIAKRADCKIYVLMRPGELVISDKRAKDKNQIIAECYPGGRRVLRKVEAE